MIHQLTSDQEKQLTVYYQEWIQLALSTERINRKKSTTAILALYRLFKLATPKIYFVESPKQMIFASKFCEEGKFNADGTINFDGIEQMSYGDQQKEAVGNYFSCTWGQYWLALYDFPRQIMQSTYTVEEDEHLDVWLNVVRNCGLFLAYDEACFVCDRPTSLKTDEQGRLDNLTGPALSYSDGYSIYARHGVLLPTDIIENPETITVKRIVDERNAEVRRVMLEIYGAAKFMFAAGAKIKHQDDFGTLYEISLNNDEPITIVRVVNSTPEPDGTYKDYDLRVPPTMKRAKEAVAWSFGMTEDQYQPTIQT